MYFLILPLTNLSQGKSAYTYRSQQPLQPGDLVQISFGKQHNLPGIIQSKTPAPRGFRVKDITKILIPGFLDDKQFKLAEKIAQDNFCSLNQALELFFSRQFLAKPSPKKTLTPEKPNQDPSFRLTSDQKNALKALDKAGAKSKKEGVLKEGFREFLLTGPAASGKSRLLAEIARQEAQAGRQVLILLPEIFLSYHEIQRYQHWLKKYQPVLFHSQNTAGQNSALRRQVQSGKARVVLATRSGVFLPFKKLGAVLVDEEHDWAFKEWNKHPRYNGLLIARHLARLHLARFVGASATPQASSYLRVKKQGGLIQLPGLRKSNLEVKKPNIELITLRGKFSKNYPRLISKELEKALEENFAKEELATVLVPRGGKSKLIICQDCQVILRCPKCERNLIHQKDFYRCPSCSFKQSSLSQCSQCQSFSLKDLGMGVEKVAAALRTRFPNQAVEALDVATFATRQTRQRLLKKIRQAQVDVLVGTYGVAKGLDDPRLGLTTILNAEDWPGNIDFRFDERFLATLFQLVGRVNRPGSDQQGRCLIQTYDPVNPRWEFLLSEEWEKAWQKFLEEDLATRKALNYPPFARFIKLSYKNKSSRKTTREVTKLQKNLQQTEPENLWEVSILPGEPQKIKGGIFAQALLLKTAPPQKNQKEDQELSKFILGLKTGWSVDVDPEDLFRP